MGKEGEASPGGDIAIVGMGLCVPGAPSAQDFWTNLRNGVESIRPLSEEELLAAGESAEALSQPNYVPAAALLDDFDAFDAEFFGFSPKEAAILDPQHRKFLEVAWEAMEQSGHTPRSMDGRVGVFAGCGMGSYFYFNICSNPGLVDDVGMFLLRHTGNDKDFLSTRVSHIFDLKGPSINLQTACSTSLVAVHYACQALRDGECDMALAGGVTIDLPQGRGYLYKENEILSPDGHCHAFDHRAQGTVFGSGAGAVALRRLEDAIADGDHIWAVVKGTAINNDGAAKAGYLAPSVEGQAEAIGKALAAAQVSAETIDYVECHGTGTYLGDPIEVSALTSAYRAQTDDCGYCGIGSVKTNIGHLDTAAGVASLIKTAMALHHREIPPSLGYEAPNPAIDFDSSPFRVNDQLNPWQSHKGPRRGAINSLGVGGTNAHAILEEAPAIGASEESDFPFQVLCLSGRSRSALDENSAALAAYLRANPEVPLADVAYTLKEAREGFEKRRVVVAETALEAAQLLEDADPRLVLTHDLLEGNPDTVFMFPGGGSQYAGMAQDLYETEPVFADWMDRGLDHLQKQLDYDIRAIWLPGDDTAAADQKLQQPSVQLPLIMIVEYALAQLWMSWGVHPTALVGHSMGENTAACLAGTIGFEDCIDLVLLRGRLFETVPAGGMLSISLPVSDVEPLLGDALDVATVNAPRLTTVSGPQAALDALAETLTTKDIDHQRIQIDIAAHSRMLEPILAEYRAFLAKLDLQPPTLPVISNRTAQPLTAAEATDPDYWVSQLREKVNYADCMNTLSERSDRVFLEVGPGKALSSLAQMCDRISPNQVLSSLRHPQQQMPDDAYFLGVIGRLWALGVEADWPQIWGESKRHRLPLPTYSFQRSQYFIAPGKQVAQVSEAPPTRVDDMERWGWRRAWRPRLPECDIDVESELDATEALTWLIFEDDQGVAAPVIDRLTAAGHRVSRVRAGDTFVELEAGSYQLGPELGKHGYDQLMHALASADRLPERIGHFWLVTGEETFRRGHSFYERNMSHGMMSLVWLSQAMSGVDMPESVQLSVFTTGAAQVRDEPLPYPEKAAVSGPLGVMPREMPGVNCRWIDIELPQAADLGLWGRLRGGSEQVHERPLTPRVLEELLAAMGNETAAWRGDRRLGQLYKPVPMQGEAPGFREGGTYLITGGFGGIGLAIARDLLLSFGAQVVLMARQSLPPRDQWDHYLARHAAADRLATRIRAVLELEQLGRGQIRVVAADVCNISQVRAAVTEAEEAFGAVTGVIHAAGQVNDGPLLARTEAEISQVLAPKVAGLRVLDEVFPDGMLELMVLFASSSTATRPAGQVDYIAANAYLNAWAQSRSAAATRVVAINWGVWGDVGMAADAMALRTGASIVEERVPAAPPLLDEAGFDGAGNRLFVSRFRAEDQWVFDEHRTGDGVALMPGTGYLELAGQALRGHGEDGSFVIRDLYFFRPLQASGQPREMVVRLEPDASHFGFSVHSSAAGGYILNAQATLQLEAGPAPECVDLDALARRCPSVKHAPAGEVIHSLQEQHLRFGPRWQVTHSTAIGEGEGLARLSLPDEYHSDIAAGYRLHPGLLDLATGWAIELAPGYDGSTLWVPVAYSRVSVWAPLPADLRSWVRLSPEARQVDGFVSFDISLMDAHGNVCVEIAGFQMQRTEEALDFSEPAQPDVDAVALGLAMETQVAPLSADEQRLAHNISQGIRADEGAQALRMALSAGCSEVVVSSMDLQALIAQADRVSSVDDDEGQTFERPQLDNEYIAPRNDTEKTLAGFFETLLGVSDVGIEDSFFDLGGHSLIAVRLFAQIKRSFGVDFPISLLFEAPSVATIAERIGVDEDGESAPDDGAVSAGDSRRYVVALHEASDSSATPFFVVAGMFGNVLNLRHLALMLGRERSVYGLQARGLIGEDPPHETIEAAATDYLQELRAVQPHGPYLLGGFSGGGITAYEMARQLEAEGETVSTVVMLDTPLPVRPKLSRPDKLMIRLHEFKRKGPGYLVDWFQERMAWEAKKKGRATRPDNGVAAFNNEKVEAAFRGAVASYPIQAWSGEVVLFRPPLDRHWKVSGGNWVSSAREYVFEDNLWHRWVRDPLVIEVPGDHDSMVLVPNVSVLAEHLREVLDRADRQGPAPR